MFFLYILLLPSTWLSTASPASSPVTSRSASRLYVIQRRQTTPADNPVSRSAARWTRGWFLFLVAVFLASRLLLLPDSVHALLTKAAIIGLLVQMGLWASAAFTIGMQLRRERQLAIDPSTVAAMDVLGFVLRVAIWTLVLLLALENLGIDITALVAGLGIGGIAVALATQNILGDLFASLSIMLDQPFVVGDFLTVNEYAGSVEKIGIKTTRLRSLSGEQLVFSNNDLLNSRIRNYGRMFESASFFRSASPTKRLSRS